MLNVVLRLDQVAPRGFLAIKLVDKRIEANFATVSVRNDEMTLGTELF